MRRVYFAFGLAGLCAGSGSLTAGALPATAQRALLDRYCVTCHNQRAKTAGLMLDKLDLDRVPESAETWEKIVRKVQVGMMPPPGMPRPDQAALDTLVASLETSLDQAMPAHINPGRVALHRLNRSEYANAVRDLLALDIDAAALLPTDDDSDGFDNIASVLKVSPSFLEQYISAAREVGALAVGDASIPPGSKVYRVGETLSQYNHIEGLPLGTRGGFLVRHNFPLDGDYRFSIGLLRNRFGAVRGMEFPHQLELTIDGVRVFLRQVGGGDNKAQDDNVGVGAEAIAARLKDIVLRVKAGPHSIGVSFIRRDFAQLDDVLQPFTWEHDPTMNGIPTVDRLEIVGPTLAVGPGDTPSRRRIFVCRPALESEELPCAKKILSILTRRAFRGPLGPSDLEVPLSFYQEGRNRGDFESGIENALQFILASPKFLFRAEPDPPNLAPGVNYRISDRELASRLSFFLWSSIPDDELLSIAARGELKDPSVLEKQVRRMLADSKSESLIDNFASEWLSVRALDGIEPDQDEFPNFDDNLAHAFRQEMNLFVGSVLRENRSVLDLLTANYTYVNERLATHYGIPNIRGDRFRRVALTDENRWGLLGKGSILTVTSYANRTSPVLRGNWILENILGTPAPPPPPNVPALKENSEGGEATSVRARLEQHRANPACATCHRVMDPLGFALENFDAIGHWRTKEDTTPIDASGQLADGTSVNGPAALREALMKHPDRFAATLTEKLLTYALGRSVAYYDMPTVRGIVREAAGNDYRFSSLILAIVKSAPFQMRRTPEAGGAVAAAAVARR